MFHINSCQGEAPGPLEKGPAGRDSMARPRLDDEERRALGQRVRMAAELRLGAAERTRNAGCWWVVSLSARVGVKYRAKSR